MTSRKLPTVKTVNSVTLVFQFASRQVETNREMRIADEPSTVAAVGGLGGLFVGFSCLDSGLKLIQMVKRFCKRSKIVE